MQRRPNQTSAVLAASLQTKAFVMGWFVCRVQSSAQCPRDLNFVTTRSATAAVNHAGEHWVPPIDFYNKPHQ